MRTLERLLNEGLAQFGFKRLTNKLFYYRYKDIMITICIECPTGLTYVWFSIIPLYMPCPGFIHFAYGNRFNTMYPDCHIIPKDAENHVIHEYCTSLLLHLKEELLPRAKRLATAKELYERSMRASKPFRGSDERYLMCDPERMRRLCLYSGLCAGMYQEAEKVAEKYIRHVRGSCKYLSVESRNRRIEETEAILYLLKNKRYAEIEDMIRRNTEENLSLFNLSYSC